MGSVLQTKTTHWHRYFFKGVLMRSEMVCRVIRGELSKEDAVAVEMALDDLRMYWEKAFGFGSLLLDDEQPGRKAHLELLIGSAENLRVRALVEAGKIENLQPPEQGFALDILQADGQRTAVLRAEDRLGLQYAVYGFAEHYLGVRFVHPLLDLQPETPPMPGDLHLVERPSTALRVLMEGSHTRAGLRGTEGRKSHFSDMGSWRWEDWDGNPERMRRYIAWGVKNRVNIVWYIDSCLICAKSQMDPFIVSDALWAYMDARGLKTLMWCGPGYLWDVQEGAYSEDDLCNHDAARVGPWDKHLCVNKPGFWKEADDWLDLLEPHAHRLAGIFTNWQENVCGEGVTEGAEDGMIRSPTDQVVDMNSARFRRPVLSRGGGCTTCGHMDNVDKWVKHLEYLKTRTAARGLPPAGISKTFWGVAEPDDGMVAERVVPHLPPGSLSHVGCLPSCHRAERVEGWPRTMDEFNRADNGNRRILLYRQLIYGCGSDMPIVPFTNLDRVDDDFRVFGKYESVAGMAYSVFVYHSMGWLLTLYAMRKQWQTGLDWKSWFRSFFAGLLPDEFIQAFLEIAATFQEVQLLEGLEPGEEPGGYYSRWGLNLHRLAPETLPAEGPLRVFERRGKLVRLVEKGSADPRGDYTSERCAPALQRILSLRAKIEHALGQVPILRDNLPDGEDPLVWNEFVLLPLRLTARFLQCRVLLAQSYLTYIRMREGVLKGQDTAADATEGAALCRQALAAQDEYIRLRPGFAIDYPQEINPDTLRNLIIWWRRLRAEPELCRDMDICAFLDRVETEE